MARTKAHVNPGSMPNQPEVTRILRPRLRRVMSVVSTTVQASTKKNTKAASGRNKKRSNGSQAPRLDLPTMSSDVELDDECNKEEPVPQTQHVTLPFLESPLSPLPASPSLVQTNQRVRHNKVHIIKFSFLFFFLLSLIHSFSTIQLCTLCQDVADAESKGKCCSCTRVVCDACLSLSPGTMSPTIVNNPTLKFVCPSCHELKDRVEGGKGKRAFLPYKVQFFIIWLVARTHTKLTISFGQGFTFLQGDQEVNALPSSPCFSNHCGASARRQINDNPLVIVHFRLAGMPAEGSPPSILATFLQTYFSDQGSLQLHDIPFDLGSMHKISAHTAAMDLLAAKLRAQPPARVLLFINTHSDQDRGDLLAGNDAKVGEFAVEVTQVGHSLLLALLADICSFLMHSSLRR